MESNLAIHPSRISLAFEPPPPPPTHTHTHAPLEFQTPPGGVHVSRTTH